MYISKRVFWIWWYKLICCGKWSMRNKDKEECGWRSKMGKKHSPVVFRSIFQLQILVTTSKYTIHILFNGTKLDAISSDKVIVHRWLLRMQDRISSIQFEVMSIALEDSCFIRIGGKLDLSLWKKCVKRKQNKLKVILYSRFGMRENYFDE